MIKHDVAADSCASGLVDHRAVAFTESGRASFGLDQLHLMFVQVLLLATLQEARDLVLLQITLLELLILSHQPLHPHLVLEVRKSGLPAITRADSSLFRVTVIKRGS